MGVAHGDGCRSWSGVSARLTGAGNSTKVSSRLLLLSISHQTFPRAEPNEMPAGKGVWEAGFTDTRPCIPGGSRGRLSAEW